MLALRELIWCNECVLTVLSRVGIEMGHYASEMMGESESSRRTDAMLQMYQRGYLAVQLSGFDKQVWLFRGGQATLYAHEACGSIVYDPDKHDGVCPA